MAADIFLIGQISRRCVWHRLAARRRSSDVFQFKESAAITALRRCGGLGPAGRRLAARALKRRYEHKASAAWHPPSAATAVPAQRLLAPWRTTGCRRRPAVPRSRSPRPADAAGSAGRDAKLLARKKRRPSGRPGGEARPGATTVVRELSVGSQRGAQRVADVGRRRRAGIASSGVQRSDHTPPMRRARRGWTAVWRRGETAARAGPPGGEADGSATAVNRRASSALSMRRSSLRRCDRATSSGGSSIQTRFRTPGFV